MTQVISAARATSACEVDRIRHRQRSPVPDARVTHALRLHQQLLQGEAQAVARLGEAIRPLLDAIRDLMA